MGLFDKFFKTSAPTLDETIKKYCEIIYWMEMEYPWSTKKPDENIIVRRFIELALGEPCDEEKFITALDYNNRRYKILDSTDKSLSAIKAVYEQILEEVSERVKKPYEERERKFNLDDRLVYNTCYKELIADIKADYEAILDVLKDDVKCEHFVQGFNKRILEKYEKDYRKQLDNCVYIVISNSFLEGNPVTKELVFNLFIDILNNRINNKSPKEWVSNFDLLHSLALHALHFEKYGNNQENYIPISDDECLEHVLSCKGYTDEINNHPFEKEEYTKKFVKLLKTAYTLGADFSSYVDSDNSLLGSRPTALSWTKFSESYFLDALANFVWKEIAEEFVDKTNEDGESIGKSQNPTDIANMIFRYIKAN